MPKVVDADLQRDDIRAAARKVFAKRGVRGTGLGHVADAVGMGRSSLYHYYPDKESLLADMIGEMLDQEREVFRSCLAGPAPALERIERLVRACADLFPDWAAFGRTTLELRLEDMKQLRRFFRITRRELGEVIALGQRDGSLASEQEPEVLASILIGSIDGVLLQYFLDPNSFPSPAELADSFVEAARKLVTP
jgi:AcrR family transcriptional regulator